MTADAFDKFWNEPHPETGTTYADIYGQTGMARMVWQASRQQMAEEAAAVCEEIEESYDFFKDNWGAIACNDCAEAIRSLATPTEGKTE